MRSLTACAAFSLKTLEPSEGLQCMAGRAGVHRSHRQTLADCRGRLFLLSCGGLRIFTVGRIFTGYPVPPIDCPEPGGTRTRFRNLAVKVGGGGGSSGQCF